MDDTSTRIIYSIFSKWYGQCNYRNTNSMIIPIWVSYTNSLTNLNLAAIKAWFPGLGRTVRSWSNLPWFPPTRRPSFAFSVGITCSAPWGETQGVYPWEFDGNSVGNLLIQWIWNFLKNLETLETITSANWQIMEKVLTSLTTPISSNLMCKAIRNRSITSWTRIATLEVPG